MAERLQLKSPVNYLIVNPKGLNHGLYEREKTIEVSPILYLAHCYARIQDSLLNKKVYNTSIPVLRYTYIYVCTCIYSRDSNGRLLSSIKLKTRLSR